MKFLGVVAALCLAIAISACGGGDSSSKANDSTQASQSEPLQPFEPEIDPPETLPKKLIINDLKEGSGPPAKPGDELVVKYFAVDKNDKERFSSTTVDFDFELGTGDYWYGWEKGIEGMKVGGRREILMPPRMTKNLGYLFYIIDLVEIREPKAPPEEQPESATEEPET
jgi:peptidylprolyl isomerase